MRGSGGLFQNLKTFGQAADNVFYQFGFLHFAVMYRTGILTQRSVQHTFKPVGGQVKAVEAAAIIVLSPSIM